MTLQPTDLERKFSRKIDQRKTVQFSPDEIDMLVEAGAYDAVVQYARKFRENQCRERSARSRSISGDNTASTPVKAVTTKSPGTTPRSNGKEALARVQAILDGRA